MKNFVTEAEFLPELESQGSIIVTTQYERPDTTVPFLNGIVMRKLKEEYAIHVHKIPGVSKFLVTKAT
jgi:hypothetical protein